MGVGADAMARMVPATDTRGLCRWSLPACETDRGLLAARQIRARLDTRFPDGNAGRCACTQAKGVVSQGTSPAAPQRIIALQAGDIRTGIAVTWLSHACARLQATRDGAGLFSGAATLLQCCGRCPVMPLKACCLALLQRRHGFTAAEVVWSQSWIRPDVKRILLKLF